VNAAYITADTEIRDVRGYALQPSGRKEHPLSSLVVVVEGESVRSLEFPHELHKRPGNPQSSQC